MIDELQAFCGGGLPFQICYRSQARVRGCRGGKECGSRECTAYSVWCHAVG